MIHKNISSRTFIGRTVYLLESTCLCGGVKVVFRQSEALMQRGIDSCIATFDRYPEWFQGEIHLYTIRNSQLDIIKTASHIICTTPRLISDLYAKFHNLTGTQLWHLCQGYEGDYEEAADSLDLIKKAYHLPVPRLTITRTLVQKLRRLTDANVYNVGQGIEHEIFYPPSETAPCPTKRLILVGPYSISIKRIMLGLQIAADLKNRIPGLKLIRISTEDSCSQEEKIYGKIDEFHVHITPEQVAGIFRRGGILLCPSTGGEGFGLPPVEAMACGLPCVLADIPSFKNFAAPDDYAVFLHSGSSEKAAEQIADLMNDPAETLRLRRRGQEVAAEFRFDRVAQKIENAFKAETGCRSAV